MEGKTMFLINLITGLFFIALGAIVRFGKASWLIAGYNTSSKEEKAKYDEAALCNFVGNLMFVLGVIVLVMGILSLLITSHLGIILGVGWTLYVVMTIGAVIYVNTGNRFKKAK